MKCGDCKSKPVLNRKVRIERLKDSPTVDENNEVDLTDDDNWEKYATRWSAIKSRGGSERFASDMIQADQTHRVYMRSDSVTRAITSAMRMVFESRKFNILAAVDEDEMRRWVVLDVVEEK